MLAVAVGYQVYELTDSALHLGLIGLVQFLPPLLLMLIAGQVADRYNRRLVLRCCFAIEFCATTGIMIAALFPQPSLAAIYGLLLINAIARTFEQPTMQSLVPVMAPRVLLSRAVAAHVSAGRLSILLGPSLGGVLYVFGPAFAYAACALLIGGAAVASFLLPSPPVAAERPKVSWDSLFAGFRFIWRCQAVLGAMSFDLMATLFGGVTALHADLRARHSRHRPVGRRHPAQLARHRGAHDRCRPDALSGAAQRRRFHLCRVRALSASA